MTTGILLRFSDFDILNTQLIDALSSQIKYTILSRATYIQGNDREIVDVATRTTTITNAFGRIIATIEWTGKEKRSGGLIKIMDDDPVDFSKLFDGCDSVKTVPDQFILPSRLGFIWTATRNSLMVYRPENNEIIGKHHERCVQVGNTVTPSPLPKVGKNYLEFAHLPEDIMAELLVDYIFMNIMRRTRFDLPRYRFPLVDGCAEVRQSLADVLSNVRDTLAQSSPFRRNSL